jgi:hypothetical protein
LAGVAHPFDNHNNGTSANKRTRWIRIVGPLLAGKIRQSADNAVALMFSVVRAVSLMPNVREMCTLRDNLGYIDRLSKRFI